jgi:hypothetical protein
MKKLIITAILAATIAAGSTIMAQDQPDEYLGLPGDNLNLYAVMKLFQESETLEGFERSLNEENSRINNLDLNGDNQIDYIRVTDYVDGDVHNIVLQAVLGRNESQDVAVFTVQRFADGSAQIQLTGDETLYGKNYIIEPNFDETPNPGYMGRPNVTVVRTTSYQIAAWPLIRFIYLPNYVVWRSSWYWGYYPVYWHPWRPFYWHYYYGYHSHWYPEYYGHYRRWDNHRYSHWDNFYYRNKRVYSPHISTRISSGAYRTTYSRPDQRSEGEQLYYRTYKEHSTRTSVTSTGNNNRRVDNRQVNGRPSQVTGNSTNRRSETVTSTRSNNSTSSVRNSNNGRRTSGGNINNKYGEKNQPGGNATNWKNRSNGNDNNSKRSSTTITGSSVPKPESGRKIETGNTKKVSQSGINNSGRRTSGNNGNIKQNNNSNKNSSVKKTDKKDTGKSDNSSRRK